MSKPIEAKKEFYCLIRYLDDVIRPLVLIIPRMNRFARTFKDNNLMPFHIDGQKLLERDKTIRSKTEELKGC